MIVDSFSIEAMDKPKLLIFTDLDGTLLDHYTYLWEDAIPALEKLFLFDIPVILCTSKTKDESVYFRGQIGLDHPFIVENGAAIYSPLGYFALFWAWESFFEEIVLAQ